MIQESIDFSAPIPVNASVDPVEAPRLSRQCKAILEFLRANGGRATNAELSRIALKYTGRLSEIRQAGYVVVG